MIGRRLQGSQLHSCGHAQAGIPTTETPSCKLVLAPGAAGTAVLAVPAPDASIVELQLLCQACLVMGKCMRIVHNALPWL